MASHGARSARSNGLLQTCFGGRLDGRGARPRPRYGIGTPLPYTSKTKSATYPRGLALAHARPLPHARTPNNHKPAKSARARERGRWRARRARLWGPTHHHHRRHHHQRTHTADVSNQPHTRAAQRPPPRWPILTRAAAAWLGVTRLACFDVIDIEMASVRYGLAWPQAPGVAWA